MTEKTETEQPRKTSGSELVEPRESQDPDHRDAGQVAIEEAGGTPNQGREEAEKLADERDKSKS